MQGPSRRTMLEGATALRNFTQAVLLLAQLQLNLPHSSAKWQPEQPGPKRAPA